MVDRDGAGVAYEAGWKWLPVDSVVVVQDVAGPGAVVGFWWTFVGLVVGLVRVSVGFVVSGLVVVGSMVFVAGVLVCR